MAALRGHTELVKTLLYNLTPEQQLKLLSVQNKEGKMASQRAAGNYGTSDTIITLEEYQKAADYRVDYRKLTSFINPFCTQSRALVAVHSLLKTALRCLLTKDGQIYLISFYWTFIIEFHCLNIE